jgi:hypothetical protein
VGTFYGEQQEGKCPPRDRFRIYFEGRFDISPYNSKSYGFSFHEEAGKRFFPKGMIFCFWPSRLLVRPEKGGYDKNRGIGPHSPG